MMKSSNNLLTYKIALGGVHCTVRQTQIQVKVQWNAFEDRVRGTVHNTTVLMFNHF